MVEQYLQFSRALSEVEIQNRYKQYLTHNLYHLTFANILNSLENTQVRERVLTSEEKKFLNQVIKHINNKLNDLGVETQPYFRSTDTNPAVEVKLSTEAIEVFERLPHSKEPLKAIFSSSGFISILIPEGLSLNSYLFMRMLAHEASHFTSLFVAMPLQRQTSRKRKLYQGFNSKSFISNPMERDKGIFSEPLAELFAGFVLEDPELNLESPYQYCLPFMVALIKDFALRTNKSEPECFKLIYRSHAVRDFKVQAILVKFYGTEFVRSLNTIPMGESDVFNPAQLLQVAQMGKISELYTSLHANFINGSGISLNGIAGKFVYSPTIK